MELADSELARTAIELRLWRFLVNDVIKPRWRSEVPDKDYADDDDLELLIWRYCLTLDSGNNRPDVADIDLLDDAQRKALTANQTEYDQASKEFARFDADGLGDIAFVEMKTRVAEIVPRIEEMLGLIDSEAVQPVKKKISGGDGLSFEDKAMALFLEEPDISDTEIARKIECTRQNVAKMKSLKKHREDALRSKYDTPRGTKKEGRVEAEL